MAFFIVYNRLWEYIIYLTTATILFYLLQQEKITELNLNVGEIMNKKLRMQIIDCYFNQANYAQIIGEQEAKVSRVVNERATLTDDEKKRWAEVLGCEVEDIF